MAQEYDFSGIWRSSYRYEGDTKQRETEHYVTMYRKGNQLIVESIPNTEGSYMMARFSIDGRIATGSYQSQNSPRSSASGALYYGAAQLILDDNGKALRGKGVGFGKNLEVKITDWELVHIGHQVPDGIHTPSKMPKKQPA